MWLTREERAVVAHRLPETAGKSLFCAHEGVFFEWDHEEGEFCRGWCTNGVVFEGGDDVLYEERVWCVQDFKNNGVIVSDRDRFLFVHASRLHMFRVLSVLEAVALSKD